MLYFNVSQFISLSKTIIYFDKHVSTAPHLYIGVFNKSPIPALIIFKKRSSLYKNDELPVAGIYSYSV